MAGATAIARGRLKYRQAGRGIYIQPGDIFEVAPIPALSLRVWRMQNAIMDVPTAPPLAAEKPARVKRVAKAPDLVAASPEPVVVPPEPDLPAPVAGDQVDYPLPAPPVGTEP